MNNFKKTIGWAVIALLVFSFTSCEKDKDETPDFVGTWMNEEVDNSLGEPLTMRTTLVLTKSTFTMTVAVDLGIIELDVAGINGNLTASGNQITIMPTSVGAADLDTGEMVWINKGDAGWEEALADMDMDESETATYRVEGNKLYITTDGDEQSFTKQ